MPRSPAPPSPRCAASVRAPWRTEIRRPGLAPCSMRSARSGVLTHRPSDLAHFVVGVIAAWRNWCHHCRSSIPWTCEPSRRCVDDQSGFRCSRLPLPCHAGAKAGHPARRPSSCTVLRRRPFRCAALHRHGPATRAGARGLTRTTSPQSRDRGWSALIIHPAAWSPDLATHSRP